MKFHHYKLTGIAAIIVIATMQSCKKDNDAQTRADMLHGTWNAGQTGIDSNSNGVWEAGERQAIPAIRGGQLSFDTDGTGRLKGDTTLSGAPTNWILSNNENDLRIIAQIPNNKPDTLNLSMISISGTELIVRNNSQVPNVYTLLRKQ